MLQQFGVMKCYFFEENNQAIFMDSECCCTILEKFLATELPRNQAKGGKNMVSRTVLCIDKSRVYIV